MVCGSRPKACAVPEAVHPWASSQMACQPSRSRGAGARISRRCKSLASICHCSRNRSISLTPITNPSLTPKRANPTPHQIYRITLRISPWLWFRTGSNPDSIRRAIIAVGNALKKRGWTKAYPTGVRKTGGQTYYKPGYDEPGASDF